METVTMKPARSLFKRLDRWTTLGGGLADEAEAFLQGHLLERMRVTGAGGEQAMRKLQTCLSRSRCARPKSLTSRRPASPALA
jgi:hypothetical protein